MLPIFWTAACLALLVMAGGAAADDGGSGKALRAEDLLEGLEAGRKYAENLERLERQLEENERSSRMHDGVSFSYERFKPYSPEANAQSKLAAVETHAREYLSRKFEIPADRISFESVRSEGSSSYAAAERQSVTCDASTSKFRTADGTCNNLNNPLFGQAKTIFQRLSFASYADGIGAVRPGPSPRAVSLAVVANESLPEYGNTLMVMQFGQFLDHDLTLAPTARLPNGSFISCCSGSKVGSPITPPPHPECLPITIPSNDPVFGPSTCMNFVRSTFGLNLDGSTPPFRQQINDNTHWLDGSQIYGSSASLAESLRDRTSGKGQLKTSLSADGRVLLPTTTCPSCFLAGDVRVAEQPLLTIMHTLFVREHNRVANQLAAAYPGNKDDWYYQQARRVVVAEWQHIVYNEYLPILIGPTLAGIASAPRSLSAPPPNPAVFNEFATAAYRMGHSQLKSFIRVLDNNGGLTSQSYFLGESFLSASRILLPGFIDSALRGLVTTPVQKVDNCFADDVTSQLYKAPLPDRLGFDLVSLNVQRGRDHGLPPYAYLWQYIDPSTTPPGTINPNPVLPSSFESLLSTTTPEILSYLKSIYASVLDVDLYIGGVTELPVPGGLVGPTFGTIIMRQFQNLKQADRFFYDDLSQPNSFTRGQLAEIRKTSLARIICDNSDGTIKNIQPRVFLPPVGPFNLPVPCASLPVPAV